MSVFVEIKGRVYVTPQLKKSKQDKDYCTLVIFSGYTDNATGKEYENYIEILWFGEKAKEVCSELTEDMHTAINARLQGGYKESQNGKMFYNLQCFGVNIIRDGEQKNTKPSKPSKEVIQNKAEEEIEDLPF